MTAPAVLAPDSRADLAALLTRSAAGDLDAFMEFYDATCHTAYRLARCTLRDPAVAEEAVLRLYLLARQRAGEQAGSGLSPLAWLLTLPHPRTEPGQTSTTC